ncbi:MAG: hypothetical protein ACI91O_000156 [Candidatus Poriferisodalaceae bacterium]|jgi:hypothetical protein
MSISPYFFFDPVHYRDAGVAHNDEFVSNDPFPHVVIDNFLPEWVIDRVIDETKARREGDWENYEDRQQKHRFISEAHGTMGPFSQHLLSEFNSAAACTFIEELTGIKGIVPDPYLQGGGLHSMKSGGTLKVHVDFNRQKRIDLARRVNLLVYLNRDWQPEWNGDLELWNGDMSQAVKKIAPVANRCVVFATSTTSFHGVPKILACPPDRSRDVIGLYYYTNHQVDFDDGDEHNTLWQERPEDNRPPGVKKLLEAGDRARQLSRRAKSLAGRAIRRVL